MKDTVSGQKYQAFLNAWSEEKEIKAVFIRIPQNSWVTIKKFALSTSRKANSKIMSNWVCSGTLLEKAKIPQF